MLFYTIEQQQYYKTIYYTLCLSTTAAVFTTSASKPTVVTVINGHIKSVVNCIGLLTLHVKLVSLYLMLVLNGQKQY